MHKRFIAIIITATVAITGFTAAPARADSDDLAKALAGIAALAIVGKIIHDRNEDKRAVTRHNVYKPPHHVQRPHPVKPRPLPPQVSRRLLPEQCLRRAEGRHGITRVFGARCLERNYRHVASLPNHCSEQVWTKRGWRWGYNAHCLRQNGYRVNRH